MLFIFVWSFIHACNLVQRWAWFIVIFPFGKWFSLSSKSIPLERYIVEGHTLFFLSILFWRWFICSCWSFWFFLIFTIKLFTSRNLPFDFFLLILELLNKIFHIVCHTSFSWLFWFLRVCSCPFNKPLFFILLHTAFARTLGSSQLDFLTRCWSI